MMYEANDKLHHKYNRSGPENTILDGSSRGDYNKENYGIIGVSFLENTDGRTDDKKHDRLWQM